MPTQPLPNRPHLEFMRKQAKSLLRHLQRGDRDALERAYAQHSQLRQASAGKIRLAQAQLVVAREYGFASWPRLVRYFQEVQRQQQGHQQLHGDANSFAAQARRLIAEHGRRRSWAGRVLAAYVPRCYGLNVDDVFASAVSEDDARLAVARMHGAPSWSVLLERLAHDAQNRGGAWEMDPLRLAIPALEAGDVAALARVVETSPQLLRPSEYDLATGHTLMSAALGQERKHGAAALRPIMDWLAARGLHRQRELNLRLCGHMRMTPEEVQRLLDQGADPSWIAPNGIPLVEHALLRYWNGEAVDIVAARTTPRRALWIAAGLGDVAGVHSFLDRSGKPTRQARSLRPDFVAVAAPAASHPLPDADDEELLVEALLVAMLNGRTTVIEYLASRGAPVNSAILGTPLVTLAVGNGMTAVVEALLRCGADLDLRTPGHDQTARELARDMLTQAVPNTEYRRVAALCGIDVESTLAAPAPPPRIAPSVQAALALARDDAARQAQHEVEPEHMLFGLLRAGGPALHVLKDSRLDVARFRGELMQRLEPREQLVIEAELPLSSAAQDTLQAAMDFAAARKRLEVYDHSLLHALTRGADDAVGRLLERYGVDVATLHARLERIL